LPEFLKILLSALVLTDLDPVRLKTDIKDSEKLLLGNSGGIWLLRLSPDQNEGGLVF